MTLGVSVDDWHAGQQTERGRHTSELGAPTHRFVAWTEKTAKEEGNVFPLFGEINSPCHCLWTLVSSFFSLPAQSGTHDSQ